MPYADKQRRREYAGKYSAEHYSQLKLLYPPGDAEMIRRAAKRYGQSNSQFVLTAVREKLLRDGVSQNAEDNAENQQ